MPDESGKLKMPPRKRSTSSILSGQAVPTSSFLESATEQAPASQETPRQPQEPQRTTPAFEDVAQTPQMAADRPLDAPERPQNPVGGQERRETALAPSEGAQESLVLHQPTPGGSNQRFQLPALAPPEPQTSYRAGSKPQRPEKAKKYLHVDDEVFRLVRSVDLLYRSRLDLSRENDVWDLILRLGLIAFSEQYLDGAPVVDMSNDPRYVDKFGRSSNR